MPVDPIAAAQLAAAQDQAKAAWSAAEAAWVQAFLTPIGIAIALLSSIAVPMVIAWRERRSLRLLAANTAAEAAGTIGLLAELADEESLWGQELTSVQNAKAFERAIARIEAFPSDRLGDAAIDTGLRLLLMKTQAASEICEMMPTVLARGKPPPEVFSDLYERRDESADLCRRIWKAAKIDPAFLSKDMWSEDEVSLQKSAF